mgnify:FL=1|jgi:hypothetical protein|tara:strand:- start:3553 stop:4293 length:741 start_codon:yes stop_codon:yes gene_type:complete
MATLAGMAEIDDGVDMSKMNYHQRIAYEKAREQEIKGAARSAMKKARSAARKEARKEAKADAARLREERLEQAALVRMDLLRKWREKETKRELKDEEKTAKRAVKVDLRLKKKEVASIERQKMMEAMRISDQSQWKLSKRAFMEERYATMPERSDLLRNLIAAGSSEEARELLRWGVDPEAAPRNSSGWSALHHACFNGDATLVVQLVVAGGNLVAKNSEGATPMDIARMRQPHIIEALMGEDDSL